MKSRRTRLITVEKTEVFSDGAPRVYDICDRNDKIVVHVHGNNKSLVNHALKALFYGQHIVVRK